MRVLSLEILLGVTMTLQTLRLSRVQLIMCPLLKSLIAVRFMVARESVLLNLPRTGVRLTQWEEVLLCPNSVKVSRSKAAVLPLHHHLNNRLALLHHLPHLREEEIKHYST